MTACVFFLTRAVAEGRARIRRRFVASWPAYINHPNVAGATVLSLGCQNAQASILMEEIRARDPQLRKPVIIVDQQSSGLESKLMEQALDKTFAALAVANRAERAPAPLSALTVGLQMRRVGRL